MSLKSFIFSFLTKVLLPIAIISAAGYGFVHLKNSRPKAPAKPVTEQVWGVSSQLVELQDIAPEITLYGSIEAGETAQLSSTVSAFVTQVNISRGDSIKKGQKLVVLDDSELRLTLAQRKASVRDVEARIKSEINSDKTNQQAFIIEQQLLAINQTNFQALIKSEINSDKTNQQALLIEQQLQAVNQKNFERQQQLVAQKLAPTSRLEDATRALQQQQLSLLNRKNTNSDHPNRIAQLESQLTQSKIQQQLSLLNRKNTISDHPNRIAQLESQLTQSKIQLQFALLDVERTQIVAPFDGRVLSVDTALGNRVRNGDRVVKLYNIQSLELRSQIPARYLPMMQTADSGRGLEASTFHQGRTYRLTLDRLSAEASSSQGGIDAFFSLGGSQNIEVGRNLQVKVKLPIQKNVAALPELAIYGQNRIYRIVDQRLEVLSIIRVGDWTSPAGDRLTLVRSNELRSGDKVLITQLPNAVTGLLVEAR